MQVINHTEKQIEPINPVNVAATVKGIVPRSFEKTFNGLSSEQVAYAFKICLDGLTREQIAIGMGAVRDNGYCPDPAMFRKWCLGIKGFINDVDPIHASYRAKNAALANMEAWLSDSTTKITNAEREAYNRCYSMFNDLKWNYSDKQKFHTYAAFKDFYDEVVKELVEKGEKQSIWVEPPKLETKRVTTKRNYLDEMTPEQKKEAEKTQQKIKDLMAGGMSMPDAAMIVMKESIKK